MRAWLALALLAVSWLPGTGHYHLPHVISWLVLVLAGLLLMPGRSAPTLDRRVAGWAAVLIVPAILLAPWPYRLAPLLLAIGLGLRCLARPQVWQREASGRASLAGLALLVQALVFLAYMALTARGHDLPAPLPGLLGFVGRLLGLSVAVDGATLNLWSMRLQNPLGATWELLVDPPSLCFLGSAVLWIVMSHHGVKPAIPALWRACVAMALWLPVRAGVLMALYANGVLRTAYEADVNQMPLLWSTPLHLLLLLPPALLYARLLPLPQTRPAAPEAESGRPAGRAAVATALAVFCLASSYWLNPVGAVRPGRVVVDEHKSQWERTDQPYTPDHYGEGADYNYAAIYNYCTHFFDMERLTGALDDAALQGVAVLIVKTPTEAYSLPEVEAIERFVACGGGLILIGEHTDYMGSGRILNAIARPYGIRFGHDCLFGIDQTFDQLVTQGLAPHPMTQYMPPFDFAVSASLTPLRWTGRTALLGRGLKRSPADYHMSNYYPVAVNRPDMRYGAFTQLWTGRHGRGRVVAFPDSTVFSNFSAFEPGKAELMLGMIDWARRRSSVPDPRWPLAVAGLALLGWGLWRGDLRRHWPLLVAAGCLGWSLAIPLARGLHRHGMTVPQPVRPLTLLTIDRTLSTVPLSKSGFIQPAEDAYGIFERWILKLGYFTRRTRGPESFAGNACVIIYATRKPEAGFLSRLVQYVEAGGKLLVIDAPENLNTTANDLLTRFGMIISHEDIGSGGLDSRGQWQAIDVPSGCSIEGGQVLATVKNTPVAAMARCGRGEVMVIGFGLRFTDTNMGGTTHMTPDPELRRVYEVEYEILRQLMTGSPRAPGQAGSVPAAQP